jgi:parallel beta-helix repeat protein
VIVTNNIVEYNVEGIGLHWLTNSSLVKDNVVRYNQKYGIFIQKQSFNNIVKDNLVVGNKAGIGLLEGSNENIVTSNTVVDNLEAIRIEPDSASNLVKENRFSFKETTEYSEETK